MKLAFRNFIRNRRVTMISVAVVLAMSFFLMAFANSIRLNQASLDDAYDHLEVNAHIKSSTVLVDPSLDEERYLSILNSGFVQEYHAVMQFKQGAKATLRGVSDPDADMLLKEALLCTTWLEGFDQSILQGDLPVCIVSADSGMELGTTQEYILNDKESLTYLTVVGLYELPYDSQKMVSYCPLSTLERICHESKVAVSYCSLAMRLGNLRQLDDFKSQMKALELDTGNAILVINDALLREVTSQLSRQIHLLESALPILLALVAGIGFGLSFLLLRGRKKEAAVLRSLGMKRGLVFVSLLLEIVLQVFGGGVLGCVATVAGLGAQAIQPHYVALLLLCYLLGGAASVWRLSGINVFTIMSAKE